MTFSTDYILPEKFCHSEKVFKWLHENVGRKHWKWSSKISVPSYQGSRQIQFSIFDDGARAIFKLTFGDHFTKMAITDYCQLFGIRLTNG